MVPVVDELVEVRHPSKAGPARIGVAAHTVVEGTQSRSPPAVDTRTIRYVQVRSFDELVAPDARTLRFTPLGLSLGGLMSATDAASFQQETIATANLVDGVPDGVRKSFDRLRMAHAHGVIFYDAFTIVYGMRWVVLEQALRERFVQFYECGVTLTNAKLGQQRDHPLPTFEELNQTSRTLGRAWKLDPGHGLPAIPVPLTLGPLLRWARLVGLLNGQRNRSAETRIFEQMRNRFAHGASYELVSPVESSRAIRDLAEVINKLWGSPTPGGRLHPDGQHRELIVLAWTTSADGHRGKASIMLPAHARALDPALSDFTFLVVLGSLNDEQLLDFDARYEMTSFPTELVWGPGDLASLREFLARGDGDLRDRCSTVDRVFAVRRLPGVVYLPHAADVLLGLPPDKQGGEWHLLRADFGLDAFNHVRHLNPDEDDLAEGSVKACSQCPVEIIRIGSWTEASDAARALLPALRPREMVNIGVPRQWDYPVGVGFD
jgi:hypothetical protein